MMKVVISIWQISDFGLAKWLPSQWSHHSIAPIEGTFGYPIIHMFLQSTTILFTGISRNLTEKRFLFDKWYRHLAPEYYLHGVVDEKTDVFAFGVFLLEIISGRKPVDGSHQSLHSWVMTISIILYIYNTYILYFYVCTTCWSLVRFKLIAG